MKKSSLLVALAAVAALWIGSFVVPALRACERENEQEQIDLCKRAVEQGDDAAAAKLREGRYWSMTVLQKLYDKDLDAVVAGKGQPEYANRLTEIYDAVAGQRDAAWSRLFWHTDLTHAVNQAKCTGRPVLSLRLLGRLDETLSCANSRFFRTALYANAEISEYLRRHYVLHWQSVREVPKITIDFGGGRTIERTITGNSIHYVLDAKGRAIDALPGLYNPADFLDQLVRAKTWSGELSKMTPEDFSERIAELHGEAMAKAEQNFAADKAEALAQPKIIYLADELVNLRPAIEASVLAVSKCMQEMPVLEKAGFASSDEMWRRIAALPRHRAGLDHGSKSLLHAQYPNAAKAMPLAVSKMRTEEPVLPLLRNFQESMAVDSVRNEYEFHYAIHGWFARGEVPADLDAFNSRVYSELFLTPDSDPWLGLALEDVYTALPNGGLCEMPATKGYQRN